MIETDDRLAGDPVWELFPSAPAEVPPFRRLLRLSTGAATIAGTWFFYPSVAVVLACLAASSKEFRAGRQLARSIPDKAGGRICSLFSFAWGAWKLGMAAFFLIFVSAIFSKEQDIPRAFVAPALLWIGGFLTAAVLTAIGLVKAYRSGLRVWIGQGINQARTLMLGMLMIGFVIVVIMPLSFWLSGPRSFERDHPIPAMIVAFCLMISGAVAMLITLDWFTRHVVADKPGKFGPKVPTLGKWDD